MRIKKRYILVKINKVDSVDAFEKMIFSTLNKLEPFLATRSNIKVIKETCLKTQSDVVGVIKINNVYVNEVIFLLSLIGKFYKSNLLTLKSSGNLRKLKLEESRYGTNAS